MSGSINRRRALLLCGIFLAAVTVAYAKTKLVMSWKNPEYSGERFKKVLVIGMSDNPAVRADFEDALAEKITRDGMEAVPGNHILFRPDSPDVELDYLKGQIRDFKIDAVLISRLISVDKTTTVISGHHYVYPYPYYSTFYGYYGHIYHQVYQPDYLREETTVRVETNFYSATPPNEEMIWTGYSDTFNPKNADKVISQLVKLIEKELQKEGIIQTSS